MNTSPNPEVAILNAALELRPEERAVYLDKACVGDADLRRRVEELLQAHEQAGDFLATPAAGLDLAKTMRISIPLAEKPGDKIGHYKLLQQIGEGGCGVVYMAEQEEPVRRRVALKVIKLGMDTKSVIARFEAERQALALMDHPNIARVFDAGATATGRPYFVMELVRGIKITDFCDGNKVPTEERLKLFIQVCHAIQHAHQKGIIHRDIKPSNILVADHDGVPVPKVIDFGIAKATTDQRLTDKTLFTAFEQFIGTPAYMSPEQAKLSGLDIDTRSDIYSLGVLLYELLTGKTPFEQKDLLSAGLDEMRRTIRETEPPKPSTRLRAMVSAELTTTANRRHTDAPKLVHTVRGDMDWIVMKCLEKDRARRYETANGLARDIERHLSHEPIMARPPSRLYEFQKTVRRHWVGFAATTTVIMALSAGLCVSEWLLHEERVARSEADAAHAREAALRRASEAGEMIREALAAYVGGNYEEAERVLNHIPSSQVKADALHAGLRRNLAWWHALLEQPQEAATDFDFLIQTDGDDGWDAITLDYVCCGTELAQLDDKGQYRQFRRAAINRFQNTTNPVIAERICKVCVLLPFEENELPQLERMNDLTVQNLDDPGLDVYSRRWAGVSRALLEYRRGNFLSAADWSRRRLAWSLKNPLAVMSGELDRQRDYASATRPITDLLANATFQAVLALSCLALHQDGESKSALDESHEDCGDEYFEAANSHIETPGRLVSLFDGMYCNNLLLEADTKMGTNAAAADRGYAAARYSLGLMYTRGEGLPKDYAKAATWYEKAARQGNVHAQVLLGAMLGRGEGLARNETSALEWLRRTGMRTSNGSCDGTVCASPWPLVAGRLATIRYTPLSSPMNSAKAMFIHLGWDNWDRVVVKNQAMTLKSDGWEFTVALPDAAAVVDCCFVDGSGNWDNNSSSNWNFVVTSGR